MGKNYYAEKLNSMKLYQVYQTEITRVKQYLEAEIDFVRRQLHGREKILELGAGYGRILKELAPCVASAVGVDISADSVEFGKEYLKSFPNCRLLVMDAHDLKLNPEFDVVLCLQNGLSAIRGRGAPNLIEQGMKVLVPGGRAYFSSYSHKFWEHRLAWFQEQADKGLLGGIDMEKTRDGNIVCKDGFTATTFSQDALEKLGQNSGYSYRIEEVDESSIFLILEK